MGGWRRPSRSPSAVRITDASPPFEAPHAMLDINLFREEKGGDPEAIRESQRRRFKPVEAVDRVIALDRQWRDERFKLDQVKKQFNSLNKEVAKKKIAKEDASELIAQVAELKAQIKELEDKEKEVAAARDQAILPIGNLVHDTVPVHDDEDFNEVLREVGQRRMEEELYNHVDLVQLLDIVNLEQGQTVAGGRGYYLIGAGVLLNQALINFGMQFLYTKQYTPVHTPFFMRKDVMAECAQLEQFDEELYKVTGEGEDKYLIATAEQTLCTLHRKQWIEPKDLPMRYCGYSTCFRKEAGSHGRDTLGIFRVHQFEKVEQFCITSPEDNKSWEMQEEMLKNSEEFLAALGLPYRVVNIVSGELNNAAAKKYDVEAWFPASKKYRELVSSSSKAGFSLGRTLDKSGRECAAIMAVAIVVSRTKDEEKKNKANGR
eukprot:jgi/Pico_ML_1/50695/g1858.t3